MYFPNPNFDPGMSTTGGCQNIGLLENRGVGTQSIQRVGYVFFVVFDGIKLLHIKLFTIQWKFSWEIFESLGGSRVIFFALHLIWSICCYESSCSIFPSEWSPIHTSCEFWRYKFATNNSHQLSCAQLLRNIRSKNRAVTPNVLRTKHSQEVWTRLKSSRAITTFCCCN